MHCLEFKCEFFPQYFVVVVIAVVIFIVFVVIVAVFVFVVVVIVVVIVLVLDREGNKLMREKVTCNTAMLHSFEGREYIELLWKKEKVMQETSFVQLFL